MKSFTVKPRFCSEYRYHKKRTRFYQKRVIKFQIHRSDDIYVVYMADKSDHCAQPHNIPICNVRVYNQQTGNALDIRCPRLRVSIIMTIVFAK